MPKRIKNTAKPLQNVANDKLSRQILENIPDILWFVDGINLSFLYITPSIKKTCNYKPKDIPGKNINFLFIENSCKILREKVNNWEKQKNFNQATPAYTCDDFGLIHKKCNIIWTATVLTPIYTENNEHFNILGISRPLSKQTKSKHELEILNASLQEKCLELKTAEEILKTNFDELLSAQSQLEEQNKDLIRAREFVKESENRYRTLFENIPEGFTLFRLISKENDKKTDFKVIEVNNTVEKALGKSKEEVIGTKLMEIYPDFDPKIVAVLKKVALSGISDRFEYYSRKIFRRYFLLSFYSPESGYVAMVSEDITERKLAEEELKEKTDQLQKLFNYNLDLLCIASTKGIFLHLNAEWSKTLGYELSDLVGQNYINFVHPDDVENTLKVIATLQMQEEVINFTNRYRCKNGTYRWIEWRSYPAGDLIYAAARDITQSRLAAEEIKKRDLLLSESQKVASLGHYVLNLQTTNWESSETLDEVFGIDKNFKRDVNGWLQIIHPLYQDKMYDYFIQYVVGKKKPFDKEYKIIRINDGEERWVHGKGNLRFDSKGKPVEMFGTIQDITEQKNTEEELVRAKERAQESDRLKTVFLQNMSHEIRTPMNAIIGFSDLIAENLDNKEKLLNYTSIIRHRSDDLLELINEILDLSKIETGQLQIHPEDCNLLELFHELHDFFMNHQHRIDKMHIELLYEYSSNQKQPYIRIDVVKLKQIFINLIHNALKYTSKGSIKFGCKAQSNNKIVFFVSDTGPGIPADKQDAVFERFMQVESDPDKQHQGSGLGLSIVKALVKLLGGDITLKSSVGEGSTFLFSLPYEVIRSKSVAPAKAQLDGHIDFNGLSVLIVEDDKFNAEFLSEVLLPTNIKVTSVIDGQQAIELVRSGTKPDVILMDIRLRGINGHEATKIIKSINPQIKIIAQTAYASPLDKQKAMDAGCDDYISKPINKELLLNKMNEQLNIH